MSDESEPSSGRSTAGESWYLVLVGGLLVVICLALGVLWVNERNRRMVAENEVMRLRRELMAARLSSGMLGRPLPEKLCRQLFQASSRPAR